MRANQISDRAVLKYALAMPWTRFPTDLVHAIRQNYKCTEAIAGKVYSRVLEKYPLRQQWIEKFSREAPDHTGAGWGIACKTAYCHWVYRYYEVNDD